MKFFLIKLNELSTEVVICSARDQQDAKIKANKWLVHNPDNYVITPLTNPGDRVHLDITVSV